MTNKRKKAAAGEPKANPKPLVNDSPHLGHYIGPAPTSAEMGLFWQIPEKVEGEPFDEDS